MRGIDFLEVRGFESSVTFVNIISTLTRDIMRQKRLYILYMTRWSSGHGSDGRRYNKPGQWFPNIMIETDGQGYCNRYAVSVHREV